MKRIVSIQDISCVGKCSLTVALPIISAAGVEAVRHQFCLGFIIRLKKHFLQCLQNISLTN